MGTAPAGTWICSAGLAEHVRVDAELLGVRPDVALGRPRRLAHHGPELAGQAQAAGAGQQAGLDVEHVAAGLGPGQPGGHARLEDLAGACSRKNRSGPSRLRQVFRLDRDRLGLALANCLATFRATRASIRSSSRTPASRV